MPKYSNFIIARFILLIGLPENIIIPLTLKHTCILEMVYLRIHFIAMRKIILINLCICLIFQISQGQNLLPERRCIWNNPGSQSFNTDHFEILNPLHFGADSSGKVDCTLSLNSCIKFLNSRPGIILFPPGTYLFLNNIILRDSLIIRGSCAEKTKFIFDLKGRPEDCISIKGKKSQTSIKLIANAFKSTNKIDVADHRDVKKGDYLKIFENDANRIFSSWASKSIGQLVKVKDKQLNELTLEEELRIDFSLTNEASYSVIFPAYFIGLEYFSIERKDATTTQTHNISLDLAAHCWINGVASRFGNFAHVTINECSHISVTNSYFTKAFDYGGGGKAYGIAIQQTSGRCLISNNIFENLRHAVLLQSSANGNVISYNYSKDPYWTGTLLPSNAAGDIVLHGNYPFQNLFEGNICQNIVIDNSHGINGPFNTFYRNRAELYGIFMNDGAGNQQNFIGNEISNQLLGQYFKTGIDHYEFGNNKNNVNIPAGTSSLTTNSLYLENTPDCLSDFNTFPSIGYPNSLKIGTNSAQQRFKESYLTICWSSENQIRETLTIESPKKLCFGTEGKFNINYVPCATFNWSTTNGKIISGQETRNVIIDWDHPGDAKIVLKYTSGPITDSTSVLVQIDNCTQTENLENISIRLELKEGRIMVITENNLAFKQLNIFNIQGKIVQSLISGLTNTRYNTPDLPNGIYVCALLINGFHHQQKIIIP